MGSYGSERTQPSFPRWRRGPRGPNQGVELLQGRLRCNPILEAKLPLQDEEQSYISAACVSRVGTYRALKVDEVGTAIEAPVHALEAQPWSGDRQGSGGTA